MFIAPLLLAAALVQDTAPPPRAPAPKRTRVPVAIAPLAASEIRLEAALPALAAAEARLEAALPVLAHLEVALPALAVLPDIAVVPALDTWPAESWDEQDPADSLYRAGRRALNRNRYQEAIDLFGQVISRYPRSAYAGEALYYTSYALYRTGDTKNLQRAAELLTQLRDKYPDEGVRGDAETLAARVDGELARRGDTAAAERNQSRADSARGPETPPGPRAPRPPREPREPRPPRPPRPPREGRSSGCDDEDDIRVAALQGLLNMDAERAVPILKAVLARRDEGSACLRRKAVWLVSQKRSPETSAILLDAVRSDPDREVREEAVFWLSQVPGEETVAALDSILRDPKTDPGIQDKAIFALSQHHSARAGGILRAFAERRDVSSELRGNAIFWLGQNRSADNAQYLKDLYAKLENDDLKKKVIFSLSQMGGADNYRWMMDIALNQNENIEIRKDALFWAAQGKGVDIADLVRLYDSMKDREMREKLIFVYSQRREDAALEKLFDIGKNDPDRELRKSAIFWIGQSRSPRAAQFLQELINQ